MDAAEEFNRACSYCLARNVPVSVCGSCEIAEYCSRKCQRAAWPTHRAYCRAPRHHRRFVDTKTTSEQRAAYTDLVSLYSSHRFVLVECVCAMVFSYAGQSKLAHIQVPDCYDPATGARTIEITAMPANDPVSQRVIDDFLVNATVMPAVVERPDHRVRAPNAISKILLLSLPDVWKDKPHASRLSAFALFASDLNARFDTVRTPRNAECTVIETLSVTLYPDERAPVLRATMVKKKQK